ncbi:MAG: alpha/beta fold hydrolase [Dehalococcoidia bacterium]
MPPVATSEDAAPWWQPGGHMQTVLPHLAGGPVVGTDEQFIVDVGERSAVRVSLTRPSAAPRGTLLLVHGLAGSSESRAPRWTTSQALARGWTVGRVDLRNCGGTVHLASTLYNAAQSADLGHVLAALEARGLRRPYAIVGFSLGGNLVLRYAGIEGSPGGAGLAPDAVVAVNPPVDLRAAAATIERPSRLPYQLFFTQALLRLLRAIRAERSVPGPPSSLRAVHTVRAFDAAFTAPDGGWPSAEDYYSDASSLPHLGAIAAPTLILSAANDPIIEPSVFEGVTTPHLRVHVATSGGHVGYWSASSRFWAGESALDFIEESVGNAGRHN